MYWEPSFLPLCPCFRYLALDPSAQVYKYDVSLPLPRMHLCVWCFRTFLIWCGYGLTSTRRMIWVSDNYVIVVLFLQSYKEDLQNIVPSPTINGWNLKLTRFQKRKSPSKPSFLGVPCETSGSISPLFQLLDGLVCPRHSGMNWWRRLGRNCKPQGWRRCLAPWFFLRHMWGTWKLRKHPKAGSWSQREQLFRS